MARQKTVEINGKKFELQTIPFKSYMDLSDRHMGPHGIVKQSAFIEELFKHCVISPKVKMSDFDDDYDTAMKLVNEIESFLKSKPDGKPGEKEGKE